jgi:hypothetical protein
VLAAEDDDRVRLANCIVRVIREVEDSDECDDKEQRSNERCDDGE